MKNNLRANDCAYKAVLPTKECVKEWWAEGKMDKHFLEHKKEWSNEEIINEIYQALEYFITRWQCRL